LPACTRYSNIKIVVGIGGAALPYVVGPACGGIIRSTRNNLGDPDAALAAMYYDTIVQEQPHAALSRGYCRAGRIMMGSDMPFPIGDLAPLKIVRETSFTDSERASIKWGPRAKIVWVVRLCRET